MRAVILNEIAFNLGYLDPIHIIFLNVNNYVTDVSVTTKHLLQLC